jgi:hypothetical protein
MMLAIDRFHNSYIVDDITGCWNWVKYLDPAGYGRFCLNGKIVLAHRFSYEIHFEKLPSWIYACHHCDNPPCVNPWHLFAGTHLDNIRDMIAKGRQVKHYKGPSGEKARTAKLTDEVVLLIRADNRRTIELAEVYGVTQRTIQLIKSRETWKHL